MPNQHKPPSPQEDQIGPIEYTPKISSTEDVLINDDTFQLISTNLTTILFDPILKNGIFRLEIINEMKLQAIGICDDSVYFIQNVSPQIKEMDKKVYYHFSGSLGHKTEQVKGNAKFEQNNCHIALELILNNQQQNSLTFFVQGQEQPNYVINIPNSVRLWVCLTQKGSSFKITKFERVQFPTAKHLGSSRGWEY
ncbi:MAG: hypothetical protein EZS28_035466 [Streblomastix strix]|uniref:CFA20 domain-containing protein n=1 Tax=Streblomastix strix TaxID=222440 RepID=A0A5J4UF18_9EUKA|nr:MAG: hypothetical protein EZS28_035466 [Streblomastix strix]